MASVLSKNETEVAKSVISAFKDNALNKKEEEEEEEEDSGSGGDKPKPPPMPTPATRVPTPSPAKTPMPLSMPPPSSASRNSSGSSVETNTQGIGGSGGGDGKPPGLGLGAMIGIIVGAVAVALMVAAFTIWYRRFKRSSSFSKDSPHRRRNGSRNEDTATDFSTINTSRMGGHNSHSNMDSFPMTNQNGSWNDPAIVANKIPLEKVQTQALISRGGFGEVYRGQYKDQTVAIKKLLPATRKDLKHIEGFFAEVKLMIALEHARIVQFIGVAWDSLSDVCVVSEFMDGGDLRTLLMRFEVQEQRPHGFDADKVKIALHVVHALTYLHSLQPIVLHRDLKSKNILLDSQLNAKLTDFGVSREQSDATMTAGVGTSLWMAPEVMMGERYDEKSDIFSFGVVLSELDSHRLPYAHAKNADTGNKLTDTAILQLVSMGRLRVEFSESVAPELQELGVACVAVDPSDRPMAAEVLYKLQLALKAATAQ